MSSSHSKIEMDLYQYRIRCEALVEAWHYILDYQDLNAWFDSNRCCIPLSLSIALRNGKKYINVNTTI